MDEELYDEFGNYIGPGLSSSSEGEGEQEPEEKGFNGASGEDHEAAEEDVGEAPMNEDGDGDEAAEVEDDEEDAEAGNAIVLAEDKKYYPTAEEVFGEDTEALVEEEDAQPITEPIIAPIKKKEIDVMEKEGREGLKALYDMEYLAGALLSNSVLVRNVALVGHLHHGKTSLMDLLFERTHETHWSPEVDVNYTDTRRDEIERGLSTKLTPVTFLLPDLKGKSYAVNIIDTPGHVNFFDEAVAAMYLCDGVLLAVDAAEGVMSGTKLAIKHALSQQLRITLVITKVDRLILELRLPPNDAYFKLKYLIDEVNDVLAEFSAGTAEPLVLSPEAGNVCFSSATSRWLFTLAQFAEMYVQEHSDVQLPPSALARRLWGDVWYDRSRRLFTRKQPAPKEGGDLPARSFVEFVLDPLYKLYSMIVGDDVDVLAKKMHQLGVMQVLRRSELRMDVKPLFKLCLGTFFSGSARGIGELIAHHLPSPKATSKTKVERLYTGPLDSEVATSMTECDPDGPTVVMVGKLLSTSDAESFLAVGRVMSGKLNSSDTVRVLGEGYNPDVDDEDQAGARVGRIFLGGGRYRVEVRSAFAGQIVLIEDVSDSIIKSATIVQADMEKQEEMYVYRPLSSILSTGATTAVVRVAVEPLRPSELPKMVDGIRKCTKSYPALQSRVEESGEHVLLATGELSLDCVLNELRDIYSEVEVKVSDPCVPFTETVSETSSLKCFAETPNKQNKITMIAEPLEDGLAEHLETGALGAFDSVDMASRKTVQNELRRDFGWDLLAAKGLWAFGPDSRRGPNCLVDDVLPAGTTDKSLFALARESIVQGFQWSTREGPLCDEPVRAVKYRILDATIAEEPIARSGAQVIPTARRASYSAFLTATPRLMEPVYTVEILCPSDSVEAAYNILARRRGFVIEDYPKAGTPLFVVMATLPVLDSFGFESDLRLFTQGQAFCLQWFDHWSVIPGDPLDKDIMLVPLQPAPQNALARECMVKTRRRKGMSEDISIGKYFDDPLLLELAQRDMTNRETD